MQAHFSTAYRADLHQNNERTVSCANHPDRVAKCLDGTADGDPTPLCLECFQAEQAAIWARMKEPTCPAHPDRPGKMPGGVCCDCYFEMRKVMRERH